jgi:hypothetical protein
MDDGFEEILARFDPEVSDLAMGARSLIEAVYPEVVEVPWPRQNVVGYGVGPKKMSEHFCYLAFHKDHINLGFNQGVELPDPTALLEGPESRCVTRRSPHPKTSNSPPCARCSRPPQPTGWQHVQKARTGRRGILLWIVGRLIVWVMSWSSGEQLRTLWTEHEGFFGLCTLE